MATHDRSSVVPDLREFVRRHSHEIPRQVVEKYGGKHIAWSLTGDAILASGGSMEEVERELAAKGIDPSQVVFDYIDPPETSSLGWGG